MRAMILAAGRGERLRPLTDRLPKPLIELGGKPLIIHHLENLAAAGFEDVVINLAWLGERISDRLGDGSAFGIRVHYSPEPPGALETAGGIVQALPLLGDEPFAVISGDIYCDYPLGQLPQPTSENLAHLVVVDNPPHHAEGDFALHQGRLSIRGISKLTYSGIGVFRPEMFCSLTAEPRPLRPVLEHAMAAGAISGEHYRGPWADIGTPERLERARRHFGREGR